MKELLSVTEFSEAVKKRKQGIYEQTKNPNSRLYPFVVFQDGKPFIKKEAIIELYESQVRQTESQVGSQVQEGKSQVRQTESQVRQTESQAGSQVQEGKSQVEQTESQVRQTKSQAGSQAQEGKSQVEQTESQAEQTADYIKFLKDQIKEKDKQINTLQQLLNQEQQLHAKTSLLLAEYSQDPAGTKNERAEQEPEPETEAEETKPKETIWKRIFKWFEL